MRVCYHLSFSSMRFLLRFLPLLALAALGSGSASAQPGAKPATAFENDYVRVNRNIASCYIATPGTCEDRVILAMGDLTLTSEGKKRLMKRGEVAIFGTRQSYEIAVGAPFFEIAIKPRHPPVRAPAERITPPANATLYEGKRFFIYEEILPIGDTRPRHSHAQRVEIRLNTGPMLRQQVWQDGKMIENEPAIVNWREPVIHVVHNIGDAPLRNFILEFIPEQAAP
jgi:hypothetical protein